MGSFSKQVCYMHHDKHYLPSNTQPQNMQATATAPVAGANRGHCTTLLSKSSSAMPQQTQTFTRHLRRKFPFSASKYVYIAAKQVLCPVRGFSACGGSWGGDQERNSLGKADPSCWGICVALLLTMPTLSNNSNTLLSGYPSLDTLSLQVAPTDHLAVKTAGRKIKMTAFLQAHSAWARPAPAQPPYMPNLSLFCLAYTKCSQFQEKYWWEATKTEREMSLLQIKKGPQRTPAAELYCSTQFIFSHSVTHRFVRTFTTEIFT